MKKWVMGIIAVILFPTLANASTLYDVYKNNLGFYPSASDRAQDAMGCGIIEKISQYTKSISQNTSLKLCLEKQGLFGGVVTKPNTFSPGTIIHSSDVNANFDTLYTLVNGNISNANINASAAIDASKVSGTAIVATPSAAQTISATTTFFATVYVSSTTGFFRVPSMTTTQRTALSGIIENGAIVYDVTLGSFEAYEGGAWSGITAAAVSAVASGVGKGVVEIATGTEAASSTPAGTGNTNAPLVIDTSNTTSSPYTTGKFIPVTQNNGKLDPLFIDQAKTYTWTTTNTFTGGVTFGNTTTTNATTTNLTSTIVSSTHFVVNGVNADSLAVASTTSALNLHYHPNGMIPGQFSLAVNITGNQTYNHNLGVKPSLIQFTCTAAIDAAGTAEQGWSTGSYASSTDSNSSIYSAVRPGSTNQANNLSTTVAIGLLDTAGGGDFNFVVVALTSATFTINVQTNVNAGGTRYCQWIAYK